MSDENDHCQEFENQEYCAECVAGDEIFHFDQDLFQFADSYQFQNS